MRKRKKVLIVIILLLFLIGCTKDEGQPEIKSKDKAPDSLQELSLGITDILNSIGDIERLTLNIPLAEKEEDKAKQQEQSEEPKQEENTEQSQSSSESQSGGGQEQQSGGQQETKPEDPKKAEIEKREKEIKSSWESIEKKLEEIHPQWNSFEVEGLKKGTTKEVMDKFETAFNKMTKSIEAKNIIEIYDYASQSFLNLKPIFDLYLDEIGGDVSVIRHAAYQGYIKALQGDIEGANTVLSNKEENINKIRLKMTKDEDKDAIEKISLSLADFKDSLPENSRRLFMIKKDIIIENIKAIEK